MALMFSNILVGIDASLCSDLALDYAIVLAKRYHAKLSVCHALNYAAAAMSMAGPVPAFQFPMLEALHAEKHAIADAARRRANAAGLNVETFDVSLEPSRGILEVAANIDADLIVVGNHGRKSWERLFNAGVSGKVLNGAHVPLLVIPHDASYAADRAA